MYFSSRVADSYTIEFKVQAVECLLSNSYNTLSAMATCVCEAVRTQSRPLLASVQNE